MKYRLTELFRCSAHPEEMLRVTEAHVSEVFPYAGELRSPVCRTGCGLLGNWFVDIPEGLPPAHRLDCRRCLGTEIESARLVCPVCGFSLDIVDGVPGLGAEAPADSGPEKGLSAKVGGIVDRLLGLRAGDLALVLAPLPAAVIERWVCDGIERLQMELNPEILMARRARSCANGQGLAHFLAGPLETSVLRPGQFDAIVAAAPIERFACSPEALELIPSLLRPAGRLLLSFPREKGERSPVAERLLRYREGLPDSFRELDGDLTPAPRVDLLLLQLSPPPVVEPESPEPPPDAE